MCMKHESYIFAVALRLLTYFRACKMLSLAFVAIFIFVLLPTGKCVGSQEQIYISSELDHDTVMLGGLFPVHAPSRDQPCGELQSFAVQQIEAMVFAVNRINEDPNLLPNVTLAFDIRDTCSNPSHALEEVFEYVQNMDGFCSGTSTNSIAVSGVVGGHFSRVSIDVANLLRLHKVPQISYTSTADLLSDKTRFDYFFRTVPPDSLQATAIADLIVLFNWTYVYLLYSDDSYGRGGITALIENLDQREPKICIAANIPLSVDATDSDYDAALWSMSVEYISNASVAVLFGHRDAAIGMMEAILQFSERDRLKDLTWIGTDSWGNSLPQKYQRLARGMLSTIPRAVEEELFDDYFISLHPSHYNQNVWFNEFWEYRFNCSLTDQTCDLGNESIILHGEEHRQFSLATLAADAVFAFAHAIHSLVGSTCADNRLCEEVLVERSAGIAIDGEQLREHLYNISFKGPSTNLVTFNDQGDEPGAYFIKNLQTASESENRYFFETVGTWHHLTGLDLSIENIEWVLNGSVPESFCSRECRGGQQRIPVAEQQCCWVCSSCQSDKGFSNGIDMCTDCNVSHMPNSERTGCIPIPISFLKWSDNWAVVLITITLCGLTATVFVCVNFIVFCNHRVIKATSREVSAILLVGIILCYLMPFPFLAMPSNAVCAIRRFGVGFSFSVCFSALLIKTNRIHRIFNQTSFSPQKPPPLTSSLSQVLLTFALIFIQVIIAVVWLAIEPPSTAIDYFPRSAELRCGESPVIGLSVTLSYNFLLLVLSTYFAFRARKVPENFNEARYINVTLYTLCIVWLAFIPTYFVTAEFRAVFRTSSLTIAIIMSATTTLVCLFVPKMILLVSLKEKGKKITTTDIPNNTTFTTTMH